MGWDLETEMDLVRGLEMEMVTATDLEKARVMGMGWVID